MKIASDSMGLEFSVSWRPFFLDPRLPGGDGKDKMQHYRDKFGAERVAQMMPRMVQTFADEGIPGYSIDGRVGNTMDSHRLLEYALTKGGPQKQDELVEVLFDRYFLKGQALSSRSVLLEAASAANLDGAEALLDSGHGSEAVWQEVETAYNAGVTGVPYFRIDGGGHGKEISGGQEAAAFLQIFRSLGPAAAALGFAVGSRVSVHSVVVKPAYNGQVGTVLGMQGSERVQVRLDDGSEVALKPVNLTPHAHADEAGVVDTA